MEVRSKLSSKAGSNLSGHSSIESKKLILSNAGDTHRKDGNTLAIVSKNTADHCRKNMSQQHQTLKSSVKPRISSAKPRQAGGRKYEFCHVVLEKTRLKNIGNQNQTGKTFK